MQKAAIAMMITAAAMIAPDDAIPFSLPQCVCTFLSLSPSLFTSFRSLIPCGIVCHLVSFLLLPLTLSSSTSSPPPPPHAAASSFSISSLANLLNLYVSLHVQVKYEGESEKEKERKESNASAKGARDTFIYPFLLHLTPLTQLKAVIKVKSILLSPLAGNILLFSPFFLSE